MRSFVFLSFALVFSLCQFTTTAQTSELSKWGFSQQTAPKGLELQESAPGIRGVDQDGNKFMLNSQLEKGPVILIFYRGEWCPYCTRHLSEIEENLPTFRQLGASVVAISPENNQNRSQTEKKTKASYPLITDFDGSIMEHYKVAFEVSADYQTKVEKFSGNALSAKHANGKNILPIPATYIIDRNGKILWKQIDPNYANRSTAAEIEAELRKIIAAEK